MSEHTEFIDLLASNCFSYNVEKEKAITWTFDKVAPLQLNKERYSYLCSKLMAKCWNSKIATSYNTGEDTYSITGNISYAPSSAYLTSAIRRTEHWAAKKEREREQKKARSHFPTISPEDGKEIKTALEVNEENSKIFKQDMYRFLYGGGGLVKNPCGEVFLPRMSGADRDKLLYNNPNSDSHVFDRYMRAHELKGTFVDKNNIPLTEITKENEMTNKVENLIQFNINNTTFTFSKDASNKIETVESALASALQAMEKIQKKVDNIFETTSKAGIKTPKNIINNLLEQEAELAKIVKKIGKIKV